MGAEGVRNGAGLFGRRAAEEKKKAETKDLKLRGASRKRSPRGAETIAPASRRGISDDPRSNAVESTAGRSRRAIEILTVCGS